MASLAFRSLSWVLRFFTHPLKHGIFTTTSAEILLGSIEANIPPYTFRPKKDAK